MNSCPKCGGDLLGDGYRYALHCEYAKEEDYEYNEPDAEVTLCDYEEEDER